MASVMDKAPTQELVRDVLTFLAGLAPGAFGAAVAVSLDKALTWTQRFSQLAIGIVVSYYVARALHAIHPFDPFVEQGISFTVGMVAHKGAQSFIQSASETLRDVPKDLWKFIKGKLGIKDG